MATNAERPALVRVFADRADAERAVDELRRAGFRDEQIGFARRDDRKHEPEGGTAIPRGKEAEAGEGMTTGALTGSVVGGLIGAAVAGLIPGIGPVLAGGILASALGGAAVGAGAGGLLGVSPEAPGTASPGCQEMSSFAPAREAAPTDRATALDDLVERRTVRVDVHATAALDQTATA